MAVIKWVSAALVFIGALNWGLVGFFDFNLVAEIFGEGSGVARVVYAVVGVAALVWLITEVVPNRRETRTAATA